MQWASRLKTVTGTILDLVLYVLERLGMIAIELGITRSKTNKDLQYEKVKVRIKGARHQMDEMMRTGLIPSYPI